MSENRPPNLAPLPDPFAHLGLIALEAKVDITGKGHVVIHASNLDYFAAFKVLSMLAWDMLGLYLKQYGVERSNILRPM